ncbi:ABC transporter permease [Leucobacter rhizosphaerae]|uniref:ABC transporter permease n=1 Tax=Leucobacter rhizosphaerae TaxID=2932245 RepID=A0ABY4FTI5_9MICO|nr:ABC transporter permease [Leucobacter rhizosphaerae]UOQ59577.1 ABC transporter permease [Leucobacter rhizosphaerae]
MTTQQLSVQPDGTVAASGSARGRNGNRWISFFLRRVVRMVVALFVIVTASFVVLRMAGGDPVRAALGPTADESVIQARRDQLGLNDPLIVQFWNYLAGLFQGDLGVSLITGRSVTELVEFRLPATLQLAGLAFLVVLLVAVPLGLGIAILTQGGRKRGTELTFTAVTGFFAAIPEYLLAVALVIIFSVTLKLLPVANMGGPETYILPVVALALGSAASLSRIARVEALNVLSEDYIRTARSKRLPRWMINFRHALPNMLTATLTLGGSLLATMIVGSVLVEQVFNWPGLGTAFVQAIVTKDYGIVQGLAIVYAGVILIVNLIVDVVLSLIDRRTTLLETA